MEKVSDQTKDTKDEEDEHQRLEGANEGGESYGEELSGEICGINCKPYRCLLVLRHWGRGPSSPCFMVKWKLC